MQLEDQLASNKNRSTEKRCVDSVVAQMVGHRSGHYFERISRVFRCSVLIDFWTRFVHCLMSEQSYKTRKEGEKKIEKCLMSESSLHVAIGFSMLIDGHI